MMRNTNLYENIMFTNKVKHIIVWGGKGKDRSSLIKRLIKVCRIRNCMICTQADQHQIAQENQEQT